jgi:hypothetical protein
VCQFDLTSTTDDNAARTWDNCVAVVTAEVMGYTSAGDVATRVVNATFKRVSGTLAIVGALQGITALVADAALAAVVADIDSTGNVIRVRATGVAGQEIDWFASMKLTMYRVT